MRKLTLSALVLTIALLAFAPPAAAIKSCEECTINDPCNLICYVNMGGQTVYMVCDEFACSGEMMRTGLELDAAGTSDLQTSVEPDAEAVILAD